MKQGLDCTVGCGDCTYASQVAQIDHKKNADMTEDL